MALVSGRRSALNPNAPVFIPASMRHVEDFSPEWWNLVTTSTSFRDYWISQHQGDDIFGEESDDVADLLPDTIDLGVDEDILNMEAQFEEFLQSSEYGQGNFSAHSAFEEMPENGTSYIYICLLVIHLVNLIKLQIKANELIGRGA